jgi:hypothetical protein
VRTYGEQMEPRQVVKGVSCDTCGKRADGEPDGWFRFSSWHSDWSGAYDDSLDYFDACSGNCLLTCLRKILDDYNNGRFDDSLPTLRVMFDVCSHAALVSLCHLPRGTNPDD